MPETLTAPETHVDGWFNHGPKILELVDAFRPQVCVELGTWLGASAIPVARSIRRWGGTVTCVDTWCGDVNGKVSGSPWMLLTCARNMVDAGVGANVRLIPAMSVTAGYVWDGLIDYLYVDADHTYTSVLADLRAWVPHVRPGGLIVGDDYHSELYPGVKQAWDEFEQERGLTLTRYQTDPAWANGIELIYGTV